MAEIEVRTAREEDRDSVLAFCTHTWDWGDYIDRIWDDWVRDPTGRLFVAVSDERPVGLAHFRMLNEQDAWLEGLRVDPGYRSQGIASALNIAMLEEAMRRGATHARLVTESTNEGSIHLMKRIYMRQVGSFAPFRANPLTATGKQHHYGSQVTHLTQRATLDDLDEIIDYLNASNIFPTVGGLYYVGFTAFVITAAFLEEKIKAQQIYLLRRWERLDGLAIAEQHAAHMGKHLSIGYIDGTTIEAVSLVAHDLHSRLPELGMEHVFVYAPDLVLIRDALTGIEYEWDGKVFLTYERGLV